MLLKLLINNCFCTTENVSFILFHLHFRFSCQAWLPEKETVGQRPLTLSISASRTHSHMQPAAHILTHSLGGGGGGQILFTYHMTLFLYLALIRYEANPVFGNGPGETGTLCRESGVTILEVRPHLLPGQIASFGLVILKKKHDLTHKEIKFLCRG